MELSALQRGLPLRETCGGRRSGPLPRPRPADCGLPRVRLVAGRSRLQLRGAHIARNDGGAPLVPRRPAGQRRSLELPGQVRALRWRPLDRSHCPQDGWAGSLDRRRSPDHNPQAPRVSGCVNDSPVGEPRRSRAALAVAPRGSALPADWISRRRLRRQNMACGRGPPGLGGPPSGWRRRAGDPSCARASPAASCVGRPAARSRAQPGAAGHAPRVRRRPLFGPSTSLRGGPATARPPDASSSTAESVLHGRSPTRPGCRTRSTSTGATPSTDIRMFRRNWHRTDVYGYR